MSHCIICKTEWERSIVWVFNHFEFLYAHQCATDVAYSLSMLHKIIANKIWKAINFLFLLKKTHSNFIKYLIHFKLISNFLRTGKVSDCVRVCSMVSRFFFFLGKTERVSYNEKLIWGVGFSTLWKRYVRSNFMNLLVSVCVWDFLMRERVSK